MLNESLEIKVLSIFLRTDGMIISLSGTICRDALT